MTARGAPLSYGSVPDRDFMSELHELESKPVGDLTSRDQMHMKIWHGALNGIIYRGVGVNPRQLFEVGDIFFSNCGTCQKVAVWILGEMVFPTSGEILAHNDLPANVKSTFDEASKVLRYSPRASAALSRLALQELCLALDCKSTNLNEQIGELVEKGLTAGIQRMLDGIRVIGNNAVHPLEIDLKDDRPTAEFLLQCINRICQRMITEVKEADALYEMLPEGAKNAIEKRDQVAPKSKVKSPDK